MFGMRFDIDSHYGLIRKTRPLLELLQKHNAKATFFCVMGNDASINEIIKLRIMSSHVNNANKINPKKRKSYLSFFRNLPKIIHTLTYPRKVGCGHHDLLKTISKAGHDIYPHGWSHIQWQRNLSNINIREHLELCIEEYRKIFNLNPVGFGSPGRVYNELALELFDEYGFLFVGDMDGEKPFKYHNYKNIQIPVTLFKTIPELKSEGLDCDDIVNKYFSHITENEFSVIYDHPDNLHSFELKVLDLLFTKLSSHGISSKTFSEIYKTYFHITK